ncbi:hypothetical protein [Paracraurococcus ruber]|uniref:Uncharacterized protein n=1 Tax=Paracraurococcus ruber TaxID=77675 RepID=A0ABS1CTN2_9PROT|nr:hypothetical protein [Paracraurococcus ruber]MBK1657561.1 hypothetical protein [Paracraurococcus ruber]TDG32079.1 hypothetical protein E2C05_08615 [Paracraurococcus ruber]
MRLKYLERHPAAREALRLLSPAFRAEERDGQLVLVARAGQALLRPRTVEELLDLASMHAGGRTSLSWRQRARPAQPMGGSEADLLRALDAWRRRAVLAEAALRSRAAPADTGAIRRVIARTLHPDAGPASEAERALRTELFQRVWSALDTVEAQA